MKPRHFWWLIEDEAEKSGVQSKVSADDRKGILDALNGNPKGSFW